MQAAVNSLFVCCCWWLSGLGQACMGIADSCCDCFSWEVNPSCAVISLLVPCPSTPPNANIGEPAALNLLYLHWPLPWSYKQTGQRSDIEKQNYFWLCTCLSVLRNRQWLWRTWTLPSRLVLTCRRSVGSARTCSLRWKHRLYINAR